MDDDLPQSIDENIETDAYDVVLQINDEQALMLISALDNGAYTTYPSDWHNVVWWLWRALDAVVPPEGETNNMEFAIAKWELPAAQAPPAPTLDQWWDVPINVSVPNPAPSWLQITGNIMRLQPGTYGLFAFMSINAVNYANNGVRLFNKTGSLVVASGDASQFDNQTIATVIARRAFGGVVLSSVADIALQVYIPSGVAAQPFGNPNSISTTNWADVILIKV